LVYCVLPQTPTSQCRLGIYDTHIKLRGSPVLEEPGLDFHQNFIFEKLQVEDMMRSKVLALPPIVPVQAVLQVLQNSTLAAIPLTWDTEAASQDKEGSVFRIEGVIKTQTLLKMLKHRIGFWVCFFQALLVSANVTRVPQSSPATLFPVSHRL
jgi:hypothetical protein